jgi:hypothetical protein
MTPFGPLDFVYTPSRDVAAELRRFVEELGAEAVFAIEAFGARVAMVRLADQPPAIVLADHVEGDRPILVYRVDDLEEAAKGLSSGCPTAPATRSSSPAATGSRSTSSLGRAPTSAWAGASTSKNGRASCR